MSHDNFEISVQYLAPILNELEKRGYTLQEVFAYAGLQLPAGCDNPGSVVLPVLDFSTLYGRSLALLEVETSERLDKRPSDKGRLEVMCCVAIACPDLRNAARQLATLSRFSHPQDISIHLEEREGTAQLTFDFHRSSRDTASLLVAAASLIFLHQIFSWVIGNRIRLRELHLKSPEPEESISLLGLLDAPVFYGQDNDAMVFDREILDFCYPFAHHDHASRRQVEAAGYRAAYAGEPPEEGLYSIPRMMVYPGDSAARFRRKVSGYYFWISALHQKLRRFVGN